MSSADRLTDNTPLPGQLLSARNIDPELKSHSERSETKTIQSGQLDMSPHTDQFISNCFLAISFLIQSSLQAEGIAD